MSTVTMNIQSALERKKILKKQIESSMSNISRISFVTHASVNDSVINGGFKREEAINAIQASYQSRKALINNYQRLSAAINKANAENKIEYVDPKTNEKITMNTAEAIRRHQEISIEMDFYNELKKQITKEQRAIEAHNTEVRDPDTMSQNISKMLSVFSNPTNQDKEKVEQKYLENNIWELIDPAGISNSIDGIIEEIQLFEANVHNALIESNLKNQITVEFED